MKHLSSILFAAALLALGATACFEDPTNPLANGPSRINLDRSSVFISVGDSVSVVAEIKDDAGNTFSAAAAGWESSAPTVATVRRDTVVIPGNAFTRAFILAVAAGKSYVRITDQGVSDSVLVWVLPLAFNGTVSPASSNVGDTLTISASSALGFSTTAGSLSEVTVGGLPVWVLSRTASQIKLIAPMVDAGSAVTITNVMLLGTVAIASLDATTTVRVTEASEPGNDDPATPAAMTLYQDYYGTVSGSDADDYIAFTTPATGDSVLVEVEWLSDADLDIGLLLGDGSDCAPNPGACYAIMGSSNNPEVGRFRLLAATTYQLDVWVYAAGASPVTFYRVRTTKIQ